MGTNEPYMLKIRALATCTACGAEFITTARGRLERGQRKYSYDKKCRPCRLRADAVAREQQARRLRARSEEAMGPRDRNVAAFKKTANPTTIEVILNLPNYAEDSQ